MHRRLPLLGLLILVISFPLHANAIPNYGPQDKTLAVLELNPKGDIEPAKASIMTDRIRSLLVKKGQYRIIERENIDRILREQGFQSTQICDETNCSVEIGRILAVKQVMIGTLSRLDWLLSLNVRLIDVEQGTIEGEYFVDCYCSVDELMLKHLPQLMQQIHGEVAQPKHSTPSAQTPKVSKPGLIGDNPSDFLKDASSSIRAHKPSLVYGDVGLFNGKGFISSLTGIAQLGYLYNFTPYWAAGISGGTLANGAGFIKGNLRLYTNDHDFAGFLDLGVESTPYLVGKLGAEYRHQSGITGSVAVELGLNSIGASLSGGYAF